MTKNDIYSRVTNLLDDEEIDTSLFDYLLDLAQARREGMRPWAKLRAVDTANTVTAGNTFLSSKTLPTNFRKFYSNRPISLIDSNNNFFGFRSGIPFEERYQYQSDSEVFYVDHANDTFYLCGNVNQTLIIAMFYIKKPTLVSSDDAAEWVFPEEYHGILPLDIATYYRLGPDYDILGNAQGERYATIANGLYREMEKWDNELQLFALQGRSYETGGAFHNSGGFLRR